MEEWLVATSTGMTIVAVEPSKCKNSAGKRGPSQTIGYPKPGETDKFAESIALFKKYDVDIEKYSRREAEADTIDRNGYALRAEVPCTRNPRDVSPRFPSPCV